MRSVPSNVGAFSRRCNFLVVNFHDAVNLSSDKVIANFSAGFLVHLQVSYPSRSELVFFFAILVISKPYVEMNMRGV